MGLDKQSFFKLLMWVTGRVYHCGFLLGHYSHQFFSIFDQFDVLSQVMFSLIENINNRLYSFFGSQWRWTFTCFTIFTSSFISITITASWITAGFFFSFSFLRIREFHQISNFWQNCLGFFFCYINLFLILGHDVGQHWWISLVHL